MNLKQDRQGARTVSDLQRRYNSKFSEVMGLSNEALTTAKETERNLAEVWASNITMTGKFTSTGKAFLPPTYDDANKILQAVLFPELYLPEDPTLYDLNADGQITEDDALLALDVANGATPMSQLPGAKEMPCTIQIDMSDAAKAIRIFGTNQFGTPVETVVGVDPEECSFATRDQVSRIVQIDEDSGCIFRNIESAYGEEPEKEWLNPPMELGVEYRTYERWNGMPVYRKLISYVFSSVHTSTRNAVPHGIENLDIVHRCVAHTYGNIFPYVWGGKSSAVSNYDSENIYLLVTGINWAESRTWYFDIYYTKTR